MLNGTVVPIAQATTFGDGRGAMLYQNHCSACHTTQVHWRDQSLAKEGTSLREQIVVENATPD
jgi:mono/diheme cytochrome c family protein